MKEDLYMDLVNVGKNIKKHSNLPDGEAEQYIKEKIKEIFED